MIDICSVLLPLLPDPPSPHPSNAEQPTRKKNRLIKLLCVDGCFFFLLLLLLWHGMKKQCLIGMAMNEIDLIVVAFFVFSCVRETWRHGDMSDDARIRYLKHTFEDFWTKYASMSIIGHRFGGAKKKNIYEFVFLCRIPPSLKAIALEIIKLSSTCSAVLRCGVYV